MTVDIERLLRKAPAVCVPQGLFERLAEDIPAHLSREARGQHGVRQATMRRRTAKLLGAAALAAACAVALTIIARWDRDHTGRSGRRAIGRRRPCPA